MVDIVLTHDDAEKYICPILLIQFLLILTYKVEKFVMIIEKNHNKTRLDD